MDETFETWLASEIRDAENMVGMYRSYLRSTPLGAAAAFSEAHARLQTLEVVRKKLEELWGLPITSGQSAAMNTASAPKKEAESDTGNSPPVAFRELET
jgi:hypothetical protein